MRVPLSNVPDTQQGRLALELGEQQGRAGSVITAQL
jgi:hypothetical protein